MRSDIVPGGTFPDYELPDHTRTLRRLSEIQGEDPMILTLARGHYCPKEHQQHLELAANYPKIAVTYTQVATISTDEHHTSQEFRASAGAQWPSLEDPERIVQKDLEIRDARPSFVDLWHDLREVGAEIWPDWDLARPGLREAWDAGDLEPFHGWNRRETESPSAA